MKKIFISLISIISILIAQIEVISLSNKVGTEIDIHENRFYRIFPKEKGFVNAQINKVSEDQYRVLIVKNVKKKKTTVRRYIDHQEFLKLKDHVDTQAFFTEQAKISMYTGMDFLRAERVIGEIQTPQYIVVKHSGNKILKGTYFKLEDNILYVQTPSNVEKIEIQNLDRISYRINFGQYEKYRYYLYSLTGIAGLSVANYFNSQRPVGFNEYGYKRNDLSVYRQLMGIVGGLIFSSEVFDAISTLLTSSDTIILSESEYEEENFK